MNSTTTTPEINISFLQQLRSQTAASHLRLEALPISTLILSPQLTKQQYGSYLNLMHDVVRDIENNLFPIVSGIVVDVFNRAKQNHLKQDMYAIQFPMKETKTVFTQEITLPFALGIFYVIEGSTLGGRVLLKNVEKTLNYSENFGARYFSGYGNTTGSRWKYFLDVLVGYEAQYGHSDEIIAGANFAFEAIYQHLSTFDNAD